jgi:FG-GAP-like repeat
MTTTPRLWKSQTQVDTADFGIQNDGQIAATHDGGYVVVWQGIGTTRGQRYDSAGNKLGGEVITSTGVGEQVTPAVTVLANGNIAVAFVDVPDSNIYVNIFAPTWGSPLRLDAIGGGTDQSLPSITPFADGSYVISYTAATSSAETSVLARIVSAGGAVGSEFALDSETDSQTSSELATLSNGNFVAVYEDEFNGSATDHDIKYGIFTKTGMPVTFGQPVPGGGGGGLETDPDVAALRDGGFVVVWTDPDSSVHDIRASILSNTGATVASNILVNTTTAATQDEASVVALADGGFLVTWEDDLTNLVRAQRFDALGSKIGVEFTVKNGVSDGFSGDSPEAALLSDGRIAYAIGDAVVADRDVVTSIWTTGWNAIASGDFNGDGTDDILWQNALGGTSEWLMSPAGGIAGFPFTPPAAGWSVVATGDLNGDGTDDIMWKNDATGSTAEWLMAPTGGANLVGTPGAPGWNVVADGDFNGDHITDLMWQHAATGSTSVWLMAPTGGAGSLLSTSPAGGWNLVASGDFNGDGTDDVLWKNAATGNTSEWLMAGGSVASNPFTPGTGGWNVVATGDFNGDHIADIMWKNGAGATSDWLMSASGGIGSNPFTPGTGGWNLIASGDFNGDGTDDLMWQNAATGATSEWLMAGGGIGSNPFTPAAPGWDVVAVGDLNGDANIDLMWQNALTGATAEWLMAPGGGVGAFVATLAT